MKVLEFHDIRFDTMTLSINKSGNTKFEYVY